jgi:hypothetical protein
MATEWTGNPRSPFSHGSVPLRRLEVLNERSSMVDIKDL